MPPEMPSQPLSFLDGLIVLFFIGGSLLIGYFLSRRARHSTDEYFKGGGNMGWFMLGTSMVATAFAADTPLALALWEDEVEGCMARVADAHGQTTLLPDSSSNQLA